jgi:predicted kinase
MDDAGYRVAYAVCEDNLRLGLVVIADSVNPLDVTREAWMDVARRAGVPFANVEVVCSNAADHRRRIETRTDPSGGPPLAWADVTAREYHPWTHPRIVIDTARTSVQSAVDAIRSSLPAR